MGSTGASAGYVATGGSGLTVTGASSPSQDDGEVLKSPHSSQRSPRPLVSALSRSSALSLAQGSLRGRCVVPTHTGAAPNSSRANNAARGSDGSEPSYCRDGHSNCHCWAPRIG